MSNAVAAMMAGGTEGEEHVDSRSDLPFRGAKRREISLPNEISRAGHDGTTIDDDKKNSEERSPLPSALAWPAGNGVARTNKKGRITPGKAGKGVPDTAGNQARPPVETGKNHSFCKSGAFLARSIAMHDNDLPDKHGQKAGKPKLAGHCVCPYWEPESRSCLLLVRDGIFLPVETHVTTYCLTNQYALCNHYERLTVQDWQAERTGQPPGNRRRSLRIPSRHLFRFSEIAGTDQAAPIREDDAWTVDLSDHGIRFTTRQSLVPETMLRFEMVRDAARPPLRGTGRVVWSTPVADSPLFHAAIAFAEHSGA